jgi:hypothetical protein
MKQLLFLCISTSLYAADIDPKKVKVPPPPKMKTRRLPAETAKRIKMGQIRVQLVEALRNNP